jgi:hypothetical protein
LGLAMIDNSSERTIDVFFYGLYMDPAVLVQKGVSPRNPRKGYVEDYVLRVGQKATLLREEGKKAFGVVYSLTHLEIHNLYWGAGLDSYRAEPVIAHVIGGASVPALCCNLLSPPSPKETNQDYIDKLRTVMGKLGLPTKTI